MGAVIKSGIVWVHVGENENRRKCGKCKGNSHCCGGRHAQELAEGKSEVI